MKAKHDKQKYIKETGVNMHTESILYIICYIRKVFSCTEL